MKTGQKHIILRQSYNCNSGKMVFREKKDFTATHETSSSGTSHDYETLIYLLFIYFFWLKFTGMHTSSSRHNSSLFMFLTDKPTLTIGTAGLFKKIFSVILGLCMSLISSASFITFVISFDNNF